ncbi:MAG: hypothetical protein AAF665_02750 [Pseudomonadota bacterium]
MIWLVGVCLMIAVGAVAGTSVAFASCSETSARNQVEVYPTAQVLPANLLRFFAHLPHPMGSKGIQQCVHLVNVSGQVVLDALLSNRFYLWSPDNTRLTLLLDPTRLKTGLAAHKAFGRALTGGPIVK